MDTFLKKPVTEDEKRIYALYRRIQDAMIAKDIDTLDQLYADDAKFVHMSGMTQTKAEYFGEIADGTLNYYHTDLTKISISVDGDRATLSCIAELTAKVYGISGTYPMRVNPKFVKKNGQWIAEN